MLGYTLEELVPLTINRVFEKIHPTDSITIEKKTTACMEKKSEFYVGDFRFYHKDGRIVWIHDRGQVVSWDSNGKPLVMTGTHTDITEKKNKEAQFESIAYNIPGAVFRYTFHQDGKDELQLVSDGAMTLWGYSAKEVMNNSRLIWDRYEKEDLKAHFESMHKAAEGLSFRSHEWRYHHPDGNLRWHRASGNPVSDNGSTTWDSVVLDVTEEKRNELEVEKSEKRFKSLVQNGSDLICILDAEANYLYVSPTSTHILGTPPEEYIGRSSLDYIHPDDKPLVFESLSKLENEKQDGLTIIRFRHRDGSWRWLETVVTNLMDDPTVGGLVANSRDVTERILTEEKLKRSEAYYRGLSESQTNYVIRIDLEGNYNYVNKKFAKEFGWLYPDGKIYGQNVLESIMVYHHEKTQDTMAKCIAEPEEVIKIEIDQPTPDGTIMTTLWNFMCVVDAEGNPSEMQCIGLDITDRIKSEKELKESEHRYSELFQLSPQPMWVYEIETMKFLDVNKAAIHRYGYSFDEFMNMTLRDIRPLSEISKLEAAVEEVRALKKNFSKGTYLHKKKDGELIVVEIKSNILFYKGKKAEVVLATDITERQKHLTAIEEQNKKLREIAWAQSHLVRAPLTNIMGLVNLLKAFPISSREGEVYLSLLKKSSEQLDGAIKNIVETSQFDHDSTQE
ncbi:MAG TPA: PAS domain S-box protein, partial [Cryomorphaceae bacterium]|nr:PAS domain S-box protein [Cryomorphaceae bacterium]